MKCYDYLIVGAGLYGSIFAYLAHKKGFRCLVIDKRSCVGGNLYTENIEGINVQKYGAHIFHTNDKRTWDFVNSFVEFNHFINSPIANYYGKLYNLPFNMNTFYQLWGVKTPEAALKKIEEQRSEFSYIKQPKNLEEQALLLGGKDIYNILIKGYTEKQWGRKATQLPAFIIKRLPFRFTFDNNYFNDRYQGIPNGGYSKLISTLLEGIECKCNVDFFMNRYEWSNLAEKVVFTGRIDEYYSFRFGKLDYRSLHFEEEIKNCCNFQGNAVVNYTGMDVPYTRIIEHKHFEFGKQPKTVITIEYPSEWHEGMEPYYPINDEKNNALLEKYECLARNEKNTIFGGRLAEYKYYDMNQIVEKLICPSFKF